MKLSSLNNLTDLMQQSKYVFFEVGIMKVIEERLKR